MIDQFEKGRRLKECRKLMNLTQKGLGEKIGYSGKYIYHLESGRRKVSVNVARGAAEVLKVRLEYLLGEDDYRTEADLKKAVNQEAFNRMGITDVLESLGVYVGYFSPALRKDNDTQPDRFLIQIAPHSKIPMKPGDYVCSAADYNYFVSSVLNMIAAQTGFFLDTRCHKMTEQEYAEKKKLDLKLKRDPNYFPYKILETEEGHTLVPESECADLQKAEIKIGKSQNP